MLRRYARSSRPFFASGVLWLTACVIFAGGCTNPLDLGRTDFGDDPQPAREARAPRYRATGSRMPAFSGSDPSERGWVRVEDLLWVKADDAEAYRKGQVRDGSRMVPTSQALSHDVRAERGFLLRTDHLAVRTNLSWDRAKRIAAAAEQHVQRMIQEFGDSLDLRLPQDPLPVLVMATRAEFELRLRGLVSDPVAWGAFYDSQTGEVNVCAEPAARGALPLVADLRHEMTHQILDLSRPPGRRGRSFPRSWFWLWEGIAVWSETLGDAPGTDSSEMRVLRFARRHEWQQWTPLVDLVALGPRNFEGRHYDQVASFMRFLMGHPTYRRKVIGLTARLLQGKTARPLADELDTPLDRLESIWLQQVGR